MKTILEYLFSKKSDLDKLNKSGHLSIKSSKEDWKKYFSEHKLPYYIYFHDKYKSEGCEILEFMIQPLSPSIYGIGAQVIDNIYDLVRIPEVFKIMTNGSSKIDYEIYIDSSIKTFTYNVSGTFKGLTNIPRKVFDDTIKALKYCDVDASNLQSWMMDLKFDKDNLIIENHFCI